MCMKEGKLTRGDEVFCFVLEFDLVLKKISKVTQKLCWVVKFEGSFLLVDRHGNELWNNSAFFCGGRALLQECVDKRYKSY